MAKSVTTSIRLEPALSRELEKVSHHLHRSKNWVISEAIRMHLKQPENSDDDLWEINSDQTRWNA